MVQCVLYVCIGMSMQFFAILLDDRDLSHQACKAQHHIVVFNRSNDKINLVALLCSSAVPHVYHLAYNHGGTQSPTNYCGD